jgi:CO dehydrogenase/acetyl-CoA synthase beta subunit
MGHGRHFIASKKFMKAEGGVARIVWMPKPQGFGDGKAQRHR